MATLLDPAVLRDLFRHPTRDCLPHGDRLTHEKWSPAHGHLYHAFR